MGWVECNKSDTTNKLLMNVFCAKLFELLFIRRFEMDLNSRSSNYVKNANQLRVVQTLP